jgi:beta-lactam-binding protein with PASTA domain
VDKGTLVDVTIVSGPSSITLGDYTGGSGCFTFGKASAEIRKLGLTATLGGTAPATAACPNLNFIAAQSPPPGTSVPVGSTVTLYTGEEASPTTSPSTSGSPSP